MSTIEEQLNAIETAIPEVYNAGATAFERGFDKGYALAEVEARQEGYDQGYNDGLTDSQAPFNYDQFWDAYQNAGQVIDMPYAYAYNGWTQEILKPKYPLYITDHMFSNNVNYSDLSNNFVIQGTIKTLQYCFYLCTNLSELPEINITKDLLSSYDLNRTFAQCKSLKSLVLNNVFADLTFTHTFANCVSLQDIIISGEIGNSIDFSSCPLSTSSMYNIINCLVPQEESSDKTITFSTTCWDSLNAETTIQKPEGFTDWKEYVLSIGWQY